MTPEAIPTLPRGVRTHYDRVRETDALLGSERVLMLDEIGKAVLDQVDGGASITAISGDLARTYGAPLDQVQADVIEDPRDLADKRLLDVSNGQPTPRNACRVDGSLSAFLPLLLEPDRSLEKGRGAFDRSMSRDFPAGRQSGRVAITPARG